MNPKKLARKVLPRRGVKLAEETYRKGRVYAFQAAKGFPAKNLRVIAVTGTDGKTSTCLFVNEMLKSAGYRTAMFTTAVIEIDSKSTPNTTHRTVVLTAELVSLLQKAKDANVDFVVLEVTSMALHQHKLIGIPIEVAVMTNLTPEHLDYHKTMESYAAAKARLFSNYMKPKHVVLNHDDEWYGFFKGRAAAPVMSYGEHKDSTVRISDVLTSDRGSTWTLAERGAKYSLKTGMPGKFNVLNASAAACVGLAVGLTPKQLVKGVAALKVVPGRMELVDGGQPFAVLVDYAVTAEALHNVLTAARGMVKGRVISVFGATGDRDKAKRPVMGEVAAKDADYVFLTDDETYTEDPDTIRAAVRAGLESANGKFTEVPDRRDAIKAAFAYAKAGDIVVLTGIGHQDSRNMGGKLVPWDEREVARELLRHQA